MSLLPTGFMRWLRLARSGQEARAERTLRAEAERAVDRRRELAEATGIARRPGGLLRLPAILAETLRITRLYTFWKNQVVKVEVLCPADQERGEARAARDTGRIVDTADAAGHDAAKARTPRG